MNRVRILWRNATGLRIIFVCSGGGVPLGCEASMNTCHIVAFLHQGWGTHVRGGYRPLITHGVHAASLYHYLSESSYTRPCRWSTWGTGRKARTCFGTRTVVKSQPPDSWSYPHLTRRPAEAGDTRYSQFPRLNACFKVVEAAARRI